MPVDLSKFDNSWYEPGRNFICLAFWYLLNAIFLQNPLNPSSALKKIVLRLFGATIGTGVVLKPAINIKYPWNLEIGDHSWLGEKAWIDSLAPVKIGKNACISQGAYLCTGNHDWSDPAFGLIVKRIVVEDGAWVGARAVILPGVTVARCSIVTAGSIVSNDTEPYMVYSGNPAVKIKERKIR